ncbi:MAG: DUF3854 domain-containing protein, partial [Kiritimatiellae bacterium]|nr:DUF3854 domain-containing protein [Kiritimatiellia bacterium]
MEDRRWAEVTRTEPCRTCGRDSWCARTRDGRVWVCRRVDTGEGAYRVDSAGLDYWVYWADGQPGSGREVELPTQPEAPRAAPEDLDRVYTALLAEFVLSEVHHENLRQRGLTDEGIRRAGYGTLPPRDRAAVARKLVERFGANLCAAIPGLYVKDAVPAPYWSLAGPAGLLIPVRNQELQIVGLKVRVDEPGDGRKYVYLSSKKHGGPGPGAPVHVPVAAALTARDVRLTEGELKADIATVLSGVPTWSVPGVSAWRGAIPLVHALGVETVRLAFDGDFATNKHVARGLVRTAEALEKETIARVALEIWPATAGKGIDDVLAAGHQPTLQTGTAARRELIRIAAQAGIDTDPRWRARVALEDLLEAHDPAATLHAALQDPLTLDGLARAAELERG